MTTITPTDTAAHTPFDDDGFDEAQLAAASFLARYSGRTSRLSQLAVKAASVIA